MECHGGFEAVPGSEGFILRSTRCSGGPQKRMYIVGGSSRLLWRGVEGRQGWAQRPARGFADIRLEAMGPGPASLGVAGRGDAWPGQTDAGPTGLRQTVCKKEKGEALRRPLNPEQSWTGLPRAGPGKGGAEPFPPPAASTIQKPAHHGFPQASCYKVLVSLLIQITGKQ